MTAGKLLLSLKTKGVTEGGEDAKLQYAEQIKIVKQGVSEAIDQEQIPPGYVDGIKKYFNDLDNVLKPDEAK